MRLELWTVLTILSMAVVTYACRAGGYWLFRQFKPSAGLQTFLNYIPGALFVSFVVPAVAAGGPKEWLGAAVTLITARLSGSLVWPIFAGTGAAWLVWMFS